MALPMSSMASICSRSRTMLSRVRVACCSQSTLPRMASRNWSGSMPARTGMASATRMPATVAWTPEASMAAQTPSPSRM